MGKRIVILGGGFAGVECAKQLQKHARKNSDIEITLVSEDNFLLFTPMLPQVASGSIQTRNIVMPIRIIIKRANFYEGRVKDINPTSKKIRLWGTPEKPGMTLEYDYLVVALGSETDFFGMSDLENNAYRMKTLNDAVEVRNRVVDMLEQADHESNEIKQSLLTFVVVGGGFSGIETAGEVHDFLMDLVKHYPNMREEDITVMVLEAINEILPGFSSKLAKFTQDVLEKRGIKIKLHTAVTGFDGSKVQVKDLETEKTYSIQAKTVIWTAGVTPVNTIKRSIFKTERGKMVVDEYLEAQGFPGVFAAGDCALCVDPTTEQPFVATAQLAEAQARLIARNLYAIINNQTRNRFSYKPKGQMAILGKRTGIASVFGMNIRGSLAWFLWRNIYLSKIPTLSKRIRLVVDWTVDFVFDRDIARLQLSNKPRIKEYGELHEIDDVW